MLIYPVIFIMCISLYHCIYLVQWINCIQTHYWMLIIVQISPVYCGHCVSPRITVRTGTQEVNSWHQWGGSVGLTSSSIMTQTGCGHLHISTSPHLQIWSHDADTPWPVAQCPIWTLYLMQNALCDYDKTTITKVPETNSWRTHSWHFYVTNTFCE